MFWKLKDIENEVNIIENVFSDKTNERICDLWRK